jgi:hypothetical protein
MISAFLLEPAKDGSAVAFMGERVIRLLDTGFGGAEAAFGLEHGVTSGIILNLFVPSNFISPQMTYFEANEAIGPLG